MKPAESITIQQHIAAEVAAARRRAGLSQVELAKRADLTQASISRLETGDRLPRLETLLAVATACGHELDLRLIMARSSTPTLKSNG